MHPVYSFACRYWLLKEDCVLLTDRSGALNRDVDINSPTAQSLEKLIRSSHHVKDQWYVTRIRSRMFVFNEPQLNQLAFAGGCKKIS
jgi:hypothetical protein